MKRYFNISYWEYLEYMQNGCIRSKDYPKEKRQRHHDDEPIQFTIYEMLDIEKITPGGRWSFFDEHEMLQSFSFGTLYMNKEYDAYLIRVEDTSKRMFVKRRLQRFGLSPEDEGEYISVLRF